MFFSVLRTIGWDKKCQVRFDKIGKNGIFKYDNQGLLLTIEIIL